MQPIIDIKHAKTATENPTVIPQKGYYVRLHYQGTEDTTTGPFTEEDKPLLIEFLNVLEAMLALYPYGKGDLDDYFDVPNYDRWFDPNEFDGTPADERRKALSVFIEYDHNDSVAWMPSYECYWHDGQSVEEYETAFVR